MFRERGYSGAGVDALAGAAGMTSGAFYGHFAGKEDCLVAVVEHAVAANEANREAGLDDAEGEEWLAGMLRRYLSEGHWRAVGEGCPIPTLISELPRCGERAREVFGEAVESLIDRMHEKSGAPSADRDVLLAALSMAVGAMALARAVGDDALSRELLNAARVRGVDAMLAQLQREDVDER